MEPNKLKRLERLDVLTNLPGGLQRGIALPPTQDAGRLLRAELYDLPATNRRSDGQVGRDGQRHQLHVRQPPPLAGEERPLHPAQRGAPPSQRHAGIRRVLFRS